MTTLSNLTSLANGINRDPSNNAIHQAYTGNVYAFYATGGFTMDQCFNTIKLYEQAQLSQYDVTSAVQLRFDVRTFNQKLGLLKDDNNFYITDSSLNTYTDRFPIDEISISADEFVDGMTSAQVISVGTYSTLYSDYIQFVNTYFGYAGGFSSLFASASEFDINKGVFDYNSFINLLNPYNSADGTYPNYGIDGTDLGYDISGENVKLLTGNITISNINSLLRYAIDANVFNNRTPATVTPIEVYGDASDIATTVGNISDPGNQTASDLCGNVTSDLQSMWKSNYGMSDGFVAGDLVFIPAGTTVKLHLDIDSELYNPSNNIGATNVLDLIQRTTVSSIGDTTSKNFFTKSSSASATNIDRTLTAPLLIKLDNLSTNSARVYPVSVIPRDRFNVDSSGNIIYYRDPDTNEITTTISNYSAEYSDSDLPIRHYMQYNYRHATGIANSTNDINPTTSSAPITNSTTDPDDGTSYQIPDIQGGTTTTTTTTEEPTTTTTEEPTV
jgi:hypothetical protein